MLSFFIPIIKQGKMLCLLATPFSSNLYKTKVIFQNPPHLPLLTIRDIRLGNTWVNVRLHNFLFRASSASVDALFAAKSQTKSLIAKMSKSKYVPTDTINIAGKTTAQPVRACSGDCAIKLCINS